MAPAEVRERGARFDTTHKLPPEAAARCIVENIDATTPTYLGRSRPIANPPGAYEVVVRLLGDMPDTAAVLVLTPQAQGSTGEWRTSPNIIYPGGAAIVEKLKGGC